MNLLPLALLLASITPAPPLTEAITAGQPATLDVLVDMVIEIRKQRADLEKQEAAALSEVRARLKAIDERLAKLDPATPPVPSPDVIIPPSPIRPPLVIPPGPSSDPLAVALKLAYQTDTGASKQAQLQLLAELYRQAADLATDPAAQTTAELMNRVKAASVALKIDGLLPMRKLIAAECLTSLGALDPPVKLTAEIRVKARDLFTRVHLALKGANS